MVEDAESDEDEYDYNDEQPSPPIQQQLMKWRLQSQANQTCPSVYRW
jgi:hypothetical protein